MMSRAQATSLESGIISRCHQVTANIAIAGSLGLGPWPADSQGRASLEVSEPQRPVVLRYAHLSDRKKENGD